MPDSHTATAIRVLCDDIDRDLAEATDKLAEAEATLRGFADDARGLPGDLPTMCREKANLLAITTDALEDEAAKLRRRLVPSARPEIVQVVDGHRLGEAS